MLGDLTRQVAITGIGLITPLGRDWGAFSERIVRGEGAISPRTLTWQEGHSLTLPMASILDFDPVQDLPNFKTDAWDRLSHLAVFAAREAVVDGGLDGSQIDALILGSSTTSIETLDDSYARTLIGKGRIPPLNIPKSMPNAPVAAMSIDLGIEGPSYALASACSSANQAIINAAQLIRFGEADRVLCGAVEAGLAYSNVNACEYRMNIPQKRRSKNPQFAC